MRVFSRRLLQAMPLIVALGCSGQAVQTSDSAATKARMRHLIRIMSEGPRIRSAPLQLDKDYSDIVRPLVEELRSLAPDATYDGFYKRVAMSKLMGMGRTAFPTLKEIFLTDSHWAVKVSVGFLVVALDGDRDPDVISRLCRLQSDADPAVRALAASYLCGRGQWCGAERARFFRDHPEEAEIARRFGEFRPWISWMAAEDVAARLAQVMEVIERGDPYLKPGFWVDGIMWMEGDPQSVYHARSRLLTRDFDMAERFLQQLFYSGCAHDGRTTVMDSLDRDDGCDAERLGRKFALAVAALGHSLPGDQCRSFQDRLRDRLSALCERWTWKATDPQALRSLIDGISMDLIRGRALVMELKDRHPNAQVRDLAGLKIRNDAEYRAQRQIDRER
jgi:hypothetical protein